MPESKDTERRFSGTLYVPASNRSGAGEEALKMPALNTERHVQEISPEQLAGVDACLERERQLLLISGGIW